MTCWLVPAVVRSKADGIGFSREVIKGFCCANLHRICVDGLSPLLQYVWLSTCSSAVNFPYPGESVCHDQCALVWDEFKHSGQKTSISYSPGRLFKVSHCEGVLPPVTVHHPQWWDSDWLPWYGMFHYHSSKQQMAFGICLRLGQTITLWEQTYHKLSTGIVSKNKLTYGRFWGGVLYVERLQLWDSGLSLFSTSITLFLRLFSSWTIQFLSWSKTSTLTSSLGSVFITIFNEKIRPSSMWRRQQSRRATATCVVISWPERGAAM